MKTVRQVFKRSPVKESIGLEIEVEGTNLPNGDAFYDTMWRKDADGSLQGESAEYILNNPASEAGIKKALNQLSTILEGSTILPSYRAGIHVHINVQELSMKQLITFICAYLIVEELLVEWCGDTRVGNHFCLRACDAEYLIDVIQSCVEEDTIAPLGNDEIRYSSINLRSLLKYGSVEFRALGSTPDFNRILTWCKVLNGLKTNSLKYTSPDNLLVQASYHGYENLLENLLGDYTKEFKSSGWLKKMRRGLIYCQDIAYARDWNYQNFNIFLPSGKGVF